MKHLRGAQQPKAVMITRPGWASVVVGCKSPVMKAGMCASGLTEKPTSVRDAESDEPAHPLVDVVVLQLNKTGADCSDVALLIGEGDAAGSLRIFELWVSVDAGVADPSIQSVHDHSQLHWRWTGGRKLLFCSRKSSHRTCLFFLCSKML